MWRVSCSGKLRKCLGRPIFILFQHRTITRSFISDLRSQLCSLLVLGGGIVVIIALIRSVVSSRFFDVGDVGDVGDVK